MVNKSSPTSRPRRFLLGFTATAVSFAACYILIELTAALLLWTKVVEVPPQRRKLLLQNFPVQLRNLTREGNIRDNSPDAIHGRWVRAFGERTIPSAKLAITLEQQFTPEIGAIRPLNFEAYYKGDIYRMNWVGNTPPLHLLNFWKEHPTQSFDTFAEFFKAVNKAITPRTRIFVTFGGSTTAFTINWPYFLYDAAKESKLNDDFLVINLGQGGAVVSGHTQMLSDWYPRLVEYLGRKPEVVLSMNGTNDMTLNAIAYSDYKLGRVPIWNYMSNAYESSGIRQQISSQQQALSSSFYAFISQIVNPAGITHIAIRVFPYTSALIVPGNFSKIEEKLESSYLAEENGETVFNLPEEAQKKIMDHYDSRLRAWYGNVRARHVCFMEFLQPFALNGVYPFNAQRKSALGWKSLGSMPKSLALGSDSMGGQYVIGPESYFYRARDLYKTLNTELGGKDKSASFIDITDAFYTKKKDLYSDDSIHYSEEGSRLIAKNILTQVARKGYLKPQAPDCR